jgi:hypothetical protein
MALDLNIEVVEATVIPWEQGGWGISYRTRDGFEGCNRVGSRSDAEALVRRLRRDNTAPSPQTENVNPFPQKIAAS